MISDNLENILSELPSGVKLVAVSKFHPLEALLEAYAMGQRAFGENRPQEFAAKAVQMPQDVEWHFIGHLQTNKLKLVLPYASLVESIDTVHLLEAVNEWGARHEKVINVLLEVHIGAEETKQGFTPEEVLELLSSVNIRSGLTPGTGKEFGERPGRESIQTGTCKEFGERPGRESIQTGTGADRYPNVNFCGLMGMASHVDDEEAVSSDFARIKALFDGCRARFPQLRDFNTLSIGMSDDWRIALRHGSTEVRIGTAIFGHRQY